MSMMRDDALKLIGARVRRLREERKVSQEEMARRSGIERSYYGRIERGAANLGVEMLVRIAEAMDVDLKELVADVGRKAPDTS